MRGSIFKQKNQAPGSWTIILDTGSFIKPAKTSLGVYLDRWLQDYVRTNLAPRTAEGYEHMIKKYLSPTLGSISLNGLKPEHLQRYYSDKLSAGCLSAQTLRHHHTCLHKALETAVEWGVIARNPADAVKLPPAALHEMAIWNEHEIMEFLEAAKSTPYFACFHLALFSGLRRSELLGLRWTDVDLLLCQLSVNRSLHVLKGGKVFIKTPKTKRSKRLIALSPAACLVLKEHRAQQESIYLQAGRLLKEEDYVFSDDKGEPLRPNTASHAWLKLVRHAGLKPIRLHDARHSHASLMLKQGTHPKIVQERLGHSSIGITLDIYSHVAPGLQEAAAKRFDEAFSPRYNEIANGDLR